MKEFFHGWRRKAGIFTLVMALALMGGWIRSYQGVDTLGFELNSKQQWIASTDGKLLWVERIEDRAISWEFLKKLDGLEVKYLLELNKERIYLPGRLIKVRTFAYWPPVVLPLTVLSAVLLLWPQRKSSSPK